MLFYTYAQSNHRLKAKCLYFTNTLDPVLFLQHCLHQEDMDDITTCNNMNVQSWLVRSDRAPTVMDSLLNGEQIEKIEGYRIDR